MLWAFRNLSKRDKAVLVIAGVVLFAAFVGSLFAFMSGVFFGGVKFPESTLIKENPLQEYRYGEYEELPLTIAFPGTAYLINIAGTELYDGEDAALFDAGNGLFIFAGTVKADDETSVFLGGRLPSMFNGMYLQGEYLRKTYGEGYFNASFAKYEGGIVTAGTEEFYCMSYRYSPENSDGPDILFGTVRKGDTASTLGLKWDKTMYLDRIFMTMRRDPGLSEELTKLKPLEEAAPSEEAVPSEEAGEEPAGDEGTEDGDGQAYMGNEELYMDPGDDLDYNGTKKSVAGEKMEEVLKKRKEDDFSLAYPGQEIFKAEAEVPEELAGKRVSVMVQFTAIYTDIYFATIKNRDTGRVESASYLNNIQDGIVLFYIDNCESGMWDIEMERGAALDSYYIDVRDAELLKGIFAPNEDHPRP